MPMEIQSGDRRLPVFIHIIAWGMLLFLPFLFSSGQENRIDFYRFAVYAMVPVVLMAVFYLNYFILTEHLLFKRRTVLFILTNGLVMVGSVWFLFYWHQATGGSSGPVTENGIPIPPPPRRFFLLRNFFFSVLTAGLAVTVKITQLWFRIEKEKREIEVARAEAELRNLKNQLNPHFLFNTLNNIYSLVAIDPDKAQHAIERLSRLLRHVLYDETQERVPLAKELEFTRNYTELMSLRLSPKTVVEVDIDADHAGLMIAPLLFITLVENAFKHGASDRHEGFIRIRISIPRPRTVECRVENSVGKNPVESNRTGIGIENLKKRLRLIYPDRHEYSYGEKEGIYSAVLSIRL